MKSIDTDVLPAVDSVKAICVLHNFLLAKEPNRIQVASDSDKDKWCTTGDTSARSQEAEILLKSRLQFDRHCATTLILQKAVTVATRSLYALDQEPYLETILIVNSLSSSSSSSFICVHLRLV
ncbi:hypothetical protein PoB_004152200 [Plakobranchus ocellatus]|uniref:Uncharacterized protein n=1 Tax=Plakobranchus ocellatus TaxID=259542 RepID=A0AAV4B7E3_9GAST|nr:hypothetical protein PoB_004152200 [Plakobranchus ocellatus]